MKKAEDLRECWERSYARRENFLFEPKDEVIRFLSRYVRKRIGVYEFKDIIEPRHGRTQLRALDYGCGIGSQSIYMANVLGLSVLGVDLSDTAVSYARTLSEHSQANLNCQFKVLHDGQDLDVDDLYFDVCICDCVLDSMPVECARKSLIEMARVTSRYIYFSVISGHETGNRDFEGEVTVRHAHEEGTVQSYFSVQKIQRLIYNIGFSIKMLQLQVYKNLTVPNDTQGLNHLISHDVQEHGRYFVVLERETK